MAYKVIILYQLYMPSYFLGTFTEYPSFRTHWSELFEPNNASKVYLLSEVFSKHSDNMCFYPIIFYYRELL